MPELAEGQNARIKCHYYTKHFTILTQAEKTYLNICFLDVSYHLLVFIQSQVKDTEVTKWIKRTKVREI